MNRKFSATATLLLAIIPAILGITAQTAAAAPVPAMAPGVIVGGGATARNPVPLTGVFCRAVGYCVGGMVLASDGIASAVICERTLVQTGFGPFLSKCWQVASGFQGSDSNWLHVTYRIGMYSPVTQLFYSQSSWTTYTAPGYTPPGPR